MVNGTEHLDDYIHIIERLKKEKENFRPEYGMRTLEQIETNLEFFTERVAHLKRLVIEAK